jgi:DNA-binding transcriptional ArsR family regulator
VRSYSCANNYIKAVVYATIFSPANPVRIRQWTVGGRYSHFSNIGDQAATIRRVASRRSTDLVHPDRDALTFTTVTAALSDPVRLTIVTKLGELDPTGELPCTSFGLPVSKSTQSGHFRALREAGVTRQRDEGTRRLNSLRREDLDARFPGLLDLAIAQGRALLSARDASAAPRTKRANGRRASGRHVRG